MKKLIIAGAFALAAVSAQAKDIVDTAVDAGSFKTLWLATITLAGVLPHEGMLPVGWLSFRSF